MISGVDPNAGISSIASQLLKKFDSNSDGQLSNDEFFSLLNKITETLTPAATGAQNGTAAVSKGFSSVTASTLLPTAEAAKTYQMMEGFDFGKLNNPLHTTPKYVFARATQDLGLRSGDRDAMSQSLPQIVEAVKQQGYPDARVIGDDKIDFGDGYGEIDVLTSWGTWWWGPTQTKS
jgi:hypothetical protein